MRKEDALESLEFVRNLYKSLVEAVEMAGGDVRKLYHVIRHPLTLKKLAFIIMGKGEFKWPAEINVPNLIPAHLKVIDDNVPNVPTEIAGITFDIVQPSIDDDDYMDIEEILKEARKNYALFGISDVPTFLSKSTDIPEANPILFPGTILEDTNGLRYLPALVKDTETSEWRLEFISERRLKIAYLIYSGSRSNGIFVNFKWTT